jgi:hypothetical protein
LPNDPVSTKTGQLHSRSATDFAAVLVTGQRLFDFFAKVERRAEMHPELQAEMEFGLANSTGSIDDFVAL